MAWRYEHHGSEYLCLGDLTSVKNALQVIYDTQTTTSGTLPESVLSFSHLVSDTYHIWIMIECQSYPQPLVGLM